MNQTTTDARDQLAGWAPNAQLLEFARALYDEAEFSQIRHLLLFFEKPYNWHREYAAWVDAGKPVNAGDNGWAVFLEGLNEL